MNEINNPRMESATREQRRRRKLLLAILVTLTLLIALVGATFAYFAIEVNNIKGNQSLIMTTAEVEGVTYQASNTIALKNAIPGASASTQFTITNPNTEAVVRYGLKFVGDINEFNNVDGEGQLLVTITGGNLSEPVVLDFTNGAVTKEGKINTDVELAPNESDNYTLKLEFVEKNVSQNSNISKNFAGHIEVTQTIAIRNQK